MKSERWIEKTTFVNIKKARSLIKSVRQKQRYRKKRNNDRITEKKKRKRVT